MAARQPSCAELASQNRPPNLSLDTIIARLEARGVGGERTGIVELARLVREPCPRCGGLRFVTAPPERGPPLRPALADVRFLAGDKWPGSTLSRLFVQACGRARRRRTLQRREQAA